MAAISRDPKPATPEEEAARLKRVAKLHRQCAADYKTGFGRKPSKLVA